jgi:protein O-mannosyl-transferase
VFAIHPLNVEAVAWVAERKGLLSGLFFVLTLAAYLHYVRRPASVARYLMVVVLFALGLMCKPMLVTLPFVLLLLDYWPLGRMATERMRHLIGEKIPLLLLTAATCAITPCVQGDAVAWSAALPLSARIGNALVSYVAYLGAWLFPINLAVFYPHRGVELAAWKPLAALLVLSGVTAAVLLRWRRNPYLPVGWLWFVGMLVPAIGLVQVGSHAMADRYMYLPQIGLCIAVTWGALAIVRSWPHRAWACGAAASVALTVLMACAAQQTTYWRDSESLWTRAVACTTRNSTAQYNLGVLLAQRGADGDAMRRFRETLAIQPCSPDAENNLGVLLAKSGQLHEAMKHFQAALRIRPDLADAHENLGTALQQQGKIADAMVHWREVVRLQPNNLRAVNQLAWTMATGPQASIRNGAEAAELAQWAVQLSRGLEPIPWGTLAAAYAEAGRFADAVKAADRAIALAAAQKDAVTADALRRQCQLYRTGCAYHESTSQRLP